MQVKSGSVQLGAGGEGCVLLDGAHSACPASPEHSKSASHSTTMLARQKPLLSARHVLSDSVQVSRAGALSLAVVVPGVGSPPGVGWATGAQPGSAPLQPKPSAHSTIWPAGGGGAERVGWAG